MNSRAVPTDRNSHTFSYLRTGGSRCTPVRSGAQLASQRTRTFHTRLHGADGRAQGVDALRGRAEERVVAHGRGEARVDGGRMGIDEGRESVERVERGERGQL